MGKRERGAETIIKKEHQKERIEALPRGMLKREERERTINRSNIPEGERERVYPSNHMGT